MSQKSVEEIAKKISDSHAGFQKSGRDLYEDVLEALSIEREKLEKAREILKELHDKVVIWIPDSIDGSKELIAKTREFLKELS